MSNVGKDAQDIDTDRRGCTSISLEHPLTPSDMAWVLRGWLENKVSACSLTLFDDYRIKMAQLPESDTEDQEALLVSGVYETVLNDAIVSASLEQVRRILQSVSTQSPAEYAMSDESYVENHQPMSSDVAHWGNIVS